MGEVNLYNVVCVEDIEELNNYEYCDHEGWECNTWWIDEDAKEDMNTYEVIFYVDLIKYSCCIRAYSIEEALGIFFVNNPHINYDMVFEHMEI